MTLPQHLHPRPSVDPPGNRADELIKATFVRAGRRTSLGRVHEAGGLRLRLPNVLRGLHPDCEAVCINTGGGMVGGDKARYAFTAERGAAVTITTQSAEKIYRATDRPTAVDVNLALAAESTIEWLPQETILYDAIALHRRLNVALEQDATLLLVESLVFGRLAMGETVHSGSLRDRWRIRRSGRLVFAEDFRLEGPIAALLNRPAVGFGARAVATVLLVCPGAEQRLDAVRAVLAEGSAETAASAWDGILTVRALSPSPDRLRATILATLQVLRGRAAPRVWQ